MMSFTMPCTPSCSKACSPRLECRSYRQPFSPFRSLYGSTVTLYRQQTLSRSAVRDRTSTLIRVRQTPHQHRQSTEIWVARRHTPSNGQRLLRSVCEVQAELKAGSKMQDYPDYYRVLKSTDGQAVALSNYEGKKPVVLFFYPRAATPGCTKQACAFRDAYGMFKDAGAEVFGISSDEVQKNSEFAKAQRLPFPLLTDQSEFLRKSFGIKGDLLGLLPGRQTFVIDKKGKVALSFNDQFNPEKHVDEALGIVKTLV